jgi:hypothetical protein
VLFSRGPTDTNIDFVGTTRTYRRNAIEFPEEGPMTGVFERWAISANRPTTSDQLRHTEHVTTRAARSDKIERLAIPHEGDYVLVIARTYYVDTKPVETCDTIFPGDRYELTTISRSRSREVTPKDRHACLMER